MIKQVNNHSLRSMGEHNLDIKFLREYYSIHGCFPLFKQVLIETRTDCNNNCPFCPHAHISKPLGVMEWDCYMTIIDQLCSLGYNGRIALMISNEPLLEDRLKKMILFAKKKSQRFFLDITTNGHLLTVDMLDDLFRLGLDNININDYRGDRDEFPNKWSKNIIPIFAAYGNNPKVTFVKRRMDEKLPNYAGNILQKSDNQKFGFCNFPFRKIAIGYNGNILLCCNDFMYKTCFGNVKTKSLYDCWYHPELNEIRMELLNNHRINICERCNDFQTYNAFSND